MKINVSDIGLPIEQEISSQIYNAIEGDVVEKIMQIGKIRMGTNYHRSMLEGHSFKVAHDTLTHYYELFCEVKEILGFEEPVDFYISGDSSVNAFAIHSEEKGQPHIINVNSSLIQLMTDDELRFVLGHEFGHLITSNASLMRLINFVFPEFKAPPVVLQYKIRLWQQLSELVADRFGFVAMPRIDVCVSAFFKMSSGLDFNKMKMRVDAFLEENNRRLDFFRNDKGVNIATHPINPIRVQALNLFSQSEFFERKGITKQELQVQMDELVEILLKIKNSELDVNLAQFIASAGLIVASADNEITVEETDRILEELSAFNIFPRDFLESIIEQDVHAIFEKSIQKIMENNPEMRESMIKYVVSIVIADNEIKDSEMELVFKIGSLLMLSPIEVAQITTQMIQQHFEPDADSIY